MSKRVGVFDVATAKEVLRQAKWVRDNRSRIIPVGSTPPGTTPRFGRHPLRLAITTELIEPNTYGSAKFTTGAKGSEAVTGDAYQMFYRAEETDAPDLPSGTKCFAIWIDCDTLTGTQTGWELTPVACIDA